jgi:hypothetical protein
LLYWEFAQRSSPAAFSSEAFMTDVPGLTFGARRNEDIALDMMKFIAVTTGYGRGAAAGAGFSGSVAAPKAEEYAGHLLELYGRCLNAVQGRK